MPDSEKKKAWMALHTIHATVKLNRNTDRDIVEYFDGKVTAGIIKAALREYAANHPKEEEK